MKRVIALLKRNLPISNKTAYAPILRLNNPLGEIYPGETPLT